MLYLSSTANLVIVVIFSIPFYIEIAGWSFKYYAIKANSPSTTIENFKKTLRFPVNLILRGNPSIISRFWGKEFANSNLNEARFQRILISIVFGLFHIPVFVGLFSENNLFDTLCTVTFLIVSPIIIVFCLRFGHRLLTMTDSR